MPSAAYLLPPFLMVSTIVVDGRRFASSTGMNCPVLASRPIFVVPLPAIGVDSFSSVEQCTCLYTSIIAAGGFAVK